MKDGSTKLKELENDKRLSIEQKKLISKWISHLRTFKNDEKILETAYTIREFGLYLGKSYLKASTEDKENYLNYKINSKESITGNRVLKVSKKTLNVYRYRLNNFYRWILNHTSHEIDEELAYPQPKIVKKEEKSLEDKCEKRVEALLNNTIICTNKKCDKVLTQDQLKEKYVEQILDKDNLEILKDYKIYKFTSGKVESYIGFITKLCFLKRLGLYLHKTNKTYKTAARQDIQRFLDIVQKGLKDKKINPTYKAHLLDFYRFVYNMFGEEQPRVYPEVVSWLYQKRKKSHDKLAKEIIQDKEIKSMLNSASEQRDRALIDVFADCSGRVGEIVNACIKDVKISNISKESSAHKHFIATITLRGKTGERTNTLFHSVSNLRLWLLNHPLKDNPEAPLFIATKENRFGQRLSRVGINKILQRTAKRAGIKKHIHAHLFRHTNLTRMARLLSESELKIHAGWGSNSKMASIYVHLTEKDVADKILQKYGLVTKEETTDNLFEVSICPNTICSYQNPGEAKFCLKCGYPLSLKTAISLNQVKEKENELQTTLFSKDFSGVDTSKNTDFKEALYQVLKNDDKLIEKLKTLITLAEELK